MWYRGKNFDQGWEIGIVKVAEKAVCVKVRVPRQASRQVRISEREGRAHLEGWRRFGRAWPPGRLPAPSPLQGPKPHKHKVLVVSCLVLSCRHTSLPL